MLANELTAAPTRPTATARSYARVLLLAACLASPLLSEADSIDSAFSLPLAFSPTRRGACFGFSFASPAPFNFRLHGSSGGGEDGVPPTWDHDKKDGEEYDEEEGEEENSAVIEEEEEDDDDDERLPPSSALLGDLRRAAASKLGADLLPAEEAAAVASSAEAEFLSAMKDVKAEFDAAKAELGSDGAVKLFMRRIEEVDERRMWDERGGDAGREEEEDVVGEWQ